MKPVAGLKIERALICSMLDLLTDIMNRHGRKGADSEGDDRMGTQVIASPRTFTDAILDDDMATILRAKTPAERLAIAFGMWSFAQQMIRLNCAREHPEWSDAELTRYVAKRMSHGAV